MDHEIWRMTRKPERWDGGQAWSGLYCVQRGRAGQSSEGQGRAGQGRAVKGRAGQGRAGQGRTRRSKACVIMSCTPPSVTGTDRQTDATECTNSWGGIR